MPLSLFFPPPPLQKGEPRGRAHHALPSPLLLFSTGWRRALQVNGPRCKRRGARLLFLLFRYGINPEGVPLPLFASPPGRARERRAALADPRQPSYVRQGLHIFSSFSPFSIRQVSERVQDMALFFLLLLMFASRAPKYIVTVDRVRALLPPFSPSPPPLLQRVHGKQPDLFPFPLFSLSPLVVMSVVMVTAPFLVKPWCRWVSPFSAHV